MAKKNKPEEKKEEKLYTLTLNAHQLALISDACDNAGRIFRGIPETSNMYDQALMEMNKDMNDTFWDKRKLLSTALKLVQQILNSENRTDRTQTEHIYHDMHQVIRNHFHKEWEQENGEKRDWSTSSTVHRTSSMDFIKINNVDKKFTTEKLSEQNKLNILESLLIIVQQDHKEFDEENTTGWDLVENAKIWLDELKQNCKNIK
jgi:hypothetical protein